ncbi:hypothetical protein CRG98_014106 [Punica granatum]|uniref:Uncharacterized protein n=1 Tax=Punica granatum TaxID=22663 RepID=A0A2I0KCL3_PUNGR|nr:hypothetical protein CRG98_014106 [Punica granatum]
MANPVVNSDSVVNSDPVFAELYSVGSQVRVRIAVIVFLWSRRIKTGVWAPRTRLAINKARWFNLCNDADILASVDSTISEWSRYTTSALLILRRVFPQCKLNRSINSSRVSKGHSCLCI